MDYQWFPHWKCIVDLAQQIGFAWPNGENWSENGQWPTAFSSSGVGGWEQVGSHEVASKSYVNTENNQMASIGAICTFTYHTKQLNPWPNSLPSHVENYSQLSACQGEIEGKQ